MHVIKEAILGMELSIRGMCIHVIALMYIRIIIKSNKVFSEKTESKALLLRVSR